MDSNKSHNTSRTSTSRTTQQQNGGSSSSKVPHRKVVPFLLNFGIILTLFVTIIQIFDPTLDNHINTIQIQQNQMMIQQPPFTVPLHQHQSSEQKEQQQQQSINSKKNNNNNHNKNEQESDQNRVLQLLNMAGVTNLNSTQMELLPKWYDVRFYCVKKKDFCL